MISPRIYNDIAKREKKSLLGNPGKVILVKLTKNQIVEVFGLPRFNPRPSPHVVLVCVLVSVSVLLAASRLKNISIITNHLKLWVGKFP